ncbi:hypothetical protein F0L68_05430 [Solihabitans fulvus]|uniref:Uncharacterized protein n=1 Tax=Solihabitans fulvus TaxID=1892852 RepID=A0A5B2XQF1_9PSEU|nr:hypothetical protein F0L68_05430 [Solihabitans fulvus]
MASYSRARFPTGSSRATTADNPAPTFRRGYGFHPLCSFVDHGIEGTGEPLAMIRRRRRPPCGSASATAPAIPSARPRSARSPQPTAATRPPCCSGRAWAACRPAPGRSGRCSS